MHAQLVSVRDGMAEMLRDCATVLSPAQDFDDEGGKASVGACSSFSVG
jgi:hypothetical protein